MGDRGFRGRAAWKAAVLLGLLGLAGPILSAGIAAAGAANAKVGVVPVDTARVKRLLKSAAEAPVVDGALTSPAKCASDGKGVWFLPVFVAPGTSEVTCNVPGGAKVVLNMGGQLCIEDDQTSRAQLPDVCKEAAADPSLQTAIVDGNAVDEFAPTSTGTFDINLPDPNGFDLPAGKTASFYIGRNIMITGLSKGEHSIRLIYRLDAAAADQFDVDTTYHVTVG